MATKTETTPRGLQIASLIALGGSFAVQWALTLSTVIQQLQDNANLSSYVGFFIGNGVVPVLFFAGAYFLNPRKVSRLGRLFESMLIMLVGQTVLQLVLQGVLWAQFAFMVNGDAYLHFILYDIGSTVVTTILYFGALVYLRTTKRWK